MKDARNVTIKDIAKAAKFSKFTVSMALRNSPRISEKTRAKISREAEKLGYKKNSVLSSIMSDIRNGNRAKTFETIALVFTKGNVMQLRPTFPMIVEGIREESERLGYTLSEIYIDNPALTPEKLERILRAKNIRGGIVTGLLEENKLPQKYASIWKKFKFVSAGLRMLEPAIDFTITDQYSIAYGSALNMIEYGYKKPAIVCSECIDRLIDGRFVAGFLRAQLYLPKAQRIPPFTDYAPPPDSDVTKFKKWYCRFKPDALLCLHSETLHWLSDMGVKVPQETAFVHLERIGSKVAGMDQNNVEVGKAAVDRLGDLLNRPPEFSRSKNPVSTVIAPIWSDAPTLVQRK